MSTVEHSSALLVKLLRQSDDPSHDDMRRVRLAIGLDLAEEQEESAVSFVDPRAHWGGHLGLFGT